MKLSASQAAKATGKSIPTITRAIGSGRLSAKKLDGGGYEIDPAELFRVFDPISEKDPVTPNELGSATPNNDKALQVEVEMLRERIADKDSTIEDLRRRLDDEAAERRKLTMLLTDQREKSAPAPASSWWPFRRANG